MEAHDQAYPIYPPVIAVKRFAQFGGKGKIQPVAFDNGDGTFTAITNPEDLFPNNGVIWVSSEYDKIENDYEAEELFRIPIKRQNFEVEIDKDQYWATGSDGKKIQDVGLYPIIEVETLPPVDLPFIREISESIGSFFLATEKMIYGPFRVSKDEEGRHKVIPLELHYGGGKLGLAPDHIFEIKISVAQKNGLLEEFYNEGNKILCLNNFSNRLSSDGFSQRDYVSDEKLLKWGAEHIQSSKEKKVTKNELTRWKNRLAEIKKFKGDDLTRKERLVKLVQKMESFEGMESLLKDAVSQNPILTETYIQQNEPEILRKEIQKIKEQAEAQYYEDRSRLNAEIEDLNNKKKTIEEQIKEREEKAAQVSHEAIDQAYKEKLRDQEKELTERIEKLSDQVSEWVKKEDIINDIEELRKMKWSENRSLEKITKEHDALKEVKIKDLINSEVIEWLQRRGDLEWEENKLVSYQQPQTTTKIDSAEKYVSLVTKGLHDRDRQYEHDEVANILITLQQSFLTVLSGEPGCGKTTLAYYLAELLGLKNNFLPISVARGWASQRDILGFYNPINSKFQEAKTRLYSFIQQQSHYDDDVLSLVLLDEANLSPMEHYWSEFLAMSDFDNVISRKICVGSGNPKDDLNIGTHMRFIATVNNDSTTERLSQRLLNRAAILTIPEIDWSTASSLTISPTDEEFLALSYPKFKMLFSADESEKDFGLTEAEDNRFKNILNELGQNDGCSQRVAVTARKRKAVENYCTVANKIFEHPEHALDYAVAQHILPMIEGFGEDFGKRLERLLEAIGRLPKSRTIVQNILAKGKAAHHSYSFFV